MLSGKELGQVAYDTWGKFGVPVFPCGDDKRPLCKWRAEASCDEHKIVAMFERLGGKARLIGAAMGEQAGLFALDFDLYKGQSAKDYMQTLMLANCLPKTRVHETKSGGVHYIYFVPEGTKSPRNSVPADGVEVRGEGGYIIVPPSRGYSVTSTGTVEAPQALLRRLMQADANFRSLSVSSLIEKVIAGESFHEALTLIAAKMHSRGEEPAKVIETLHKAMMGSVAANPMHERHDRWAKIMSGKDGELARLSASAYKKYSPLRDKIDTDQVSSAVSTAMQKRSFRAGTSNSLAGFFAPKPADAANSEPDGASPVVADGWVAAAKKDKHDVTALGTIDEFPFPRSYSASAVDQQDNKVFLIYPLIMESDVVVLSAEPKAGKTLVGMNLCLHAASGKPIGGDLVPMNKDGKTAKIPVIYFALEGQGAVRKRVKAWLENNRNPDGSLLSEDDLHIFVVEMPINLASDEAKQNLVDKLLRANAFFVGKGWGELGIVVFDTLTKAMPGKDQNSVEDTSSVFQTIDMMREVNLTCSVIFVHHNNKNSRSPRGSSNILAEPDTILLVRKAEPVMVDDTERSVHELSVYMARAVDDGQVYRFSAKEVEIGVNSQGILEKAPALELVENYDAAPRKADVVLRKAAQSAKAAFYETIWQALADADGMFLTFSQLKRKLEGVPPAAAYFNGHLNDNSKRGAMVAWDVLVAQQQLPEGLVGMSFSVDEHGVTMKFEEGEENGEEERNTGKG